MSLKRHGRTCRRQSARLKMAGIGQGHLGMVGAVGHDRDGQKQSGMVGGTGNGQRWPVMVETVEPVGDCRA